MNETLRKLLARLGVTVPENADITDEQASAALSALDALETDAGKVASLSAELEKAQKAAVDLTKYVPVESYNALRDELAQATAQSATASLSAVLDKAEQEGRIFKSERTYLEQLGGQIGVAALSAQLEKKQPIAALSAMQTTTAKIPSQEKPAVAVLSAEDLAAARLLGKTEAEFLKLKEFKIMPTPITPAMITSLMTGYRGDFQAGMAMARHPVPENCNDRAIHVENQHVRLAGPVSAIP